MLMGAATMDIPAIVLSGGPMLDGHWKDRLVGSGTIVWESRRLLAAGEIDYDEFMNRVCAAAPSLGHCNTMGTASTMNGLAEALGMSLTGCSSIPAPFRERMEMAYMTGLRIVGMVHEELRPSQIMTRAAFLNAIVTNTAIGGSTNAPPHLQAVARHMGVDLSVQDWQDHGYDKPLLVNMQPAGEYLGEGFHQAGGIPAVMGELMKAGMLDGSALTVTGKTMAENLDGKQSQDRAVI
jgi:dihydroxy-acid dehydratase